MVECYGWSDERHLLRAAEGAASDLDRVKVQIGGELYGEVIATIAVTDEEIAVGTSLSAMARRAGGGHGGFSSFELKGAAKTGHLPPRACLIPRRSDPHDGRLASAGRPDRPTRVRCARRW
jgi:hypothetical protein